MKISCPSCQSSYKIADEKVQGRTVKVTCKKCGLTIHVNEQGVTNKAGAAGGSSSAGGALDSGEADFGSGPGGPSDAASEAGAQYSVLVSEGNQKDMTLSEIVAAYKSGVVDNDTFVWADGQADWLPLNQVPSIVNALGGSDAVDHAGPRPIGASPRGFTPADRKSPLGAPLAAVQSNHQRKPDLFATQAHAIADDDISTSAPRVASPTKSTTAHDESSVLFSLSALTSATAAAPAAPSVETGPNNDDSGLIDLRALRDRAKARQATAVPAISPAIAAAPLFGSSLVDPSLNQLSVSEPRPAKSNTMAIAGFAIGGISVVALVLVIIFAVVRKPEQPQVPVPQAVATTATQTVPAPTVEPTTTAAAPATGIPSATAAATGAKPPSGGGRGSAKPSGTATAAAQPTTPPAATTAAKPANKCGCVPGEGYLACSMACSLK